MLGLDRNFQVQRYESPGVREAHGGRVVLMEGSNRVSLGGQSDSHEGQIGSQGEPGVHGV